MNRPAPADPPSPARQNVIGWIAAALVLLAAITLALHPVATTDFFWQLGTGESILDEGRVPRADRFSYTATGSDWIDLHWGFQIGLALLHRAAGLDGLTLARALCTAALAALLLFAFAPGSVRLSALAVALLVLITAHERFLLRPELISFLLLGSCLAILDRRDRAAGSRTVWLLPPLVALWANLHSLFILGPAVIGLAAAGEVIDRWRSGRPTLRPERPVVTTGSIGTLLLVAAVAAAAALLNPFGVRAYLLPWQQFTARIAPGNLYAGSIAEFQQPFDLSTGGFAIIGGWLVAALFVVVAAVRGRRLPARQLLWAIAFGLLAWRARRNLPLFAIAATPILISGLRGGWRGWTTGPIRRAVAVVGRIGMGIVALLLVVCVVSGHFYRWERMDRRFGSGVQEGVAAHGAAGLLAKGGLPGAIFHALDDGGYLIWRLWPDRQVHIDGRLEVYPEAIYRGYLEALADPARFETLVRRYDIRTVIWNPSQALIAHRLLGYLGGSGSWRPIHLDAHSIVYRRGRVEPPGEPPSLDFETISPLDVLDRGAPPPTRMDRLLTGRGPTPRHDDGGTAAVRLGVLMALIGQPRLAESFLLAASTPAALPEVHFNLGLLYDGTGLAEKAVLAYEEARQRSRWFRDPFGLLFRREFGDDLQVRLGDAYIRSGLEERGRPLLERAGRRGRARLRALDGFRLQEGGDVAGAVDAYREALELDPDHPEVLFNLGQVLIAAGVEQLDAGGDPDAALEEARQSFAAAIRARPDFARAHFNLGLLLNQQGQRQAALHELAAAVAGEPDNADFRFQLGAARLQGGRVDAAAADMEAAIALRPEFPPAHFQLGLARQAQGRLEEALEAYLEAHRLGQADAGVLLRIAWMHALGGDTDGALKWLRQVPMPESTLRPLLRSNPDLAPLIDRLFPGSHPPS